MVDSQQVSTLADLVMSEISKDIAAGKVPAGVGSFTALHDHVDANEYLTGVPHESGDYTLVNAVTAEVDLRLRLTVSVQCYRCPCCGDDVMDSGPVCGDCREAACEFSYDGDGDLGYSNCQREDGCE